MPTSPIPFTNLPTTTALSGAELVPVVQDGISKTALVAQLALGTSAVPSVTGSRGGNAALANLLTQLSCIGIIINNSTT